MTSSHCRAEAIKVDLHQVKRPTDLRGGFLYVIYVT